MAPKFGTSGLRGLVTELTPALVADYVRAFVAACPVGTGLWVGRDLRASSSDLSRIVLETARNLGLSTVDCGAVPTPALAMAAMHAGAAAIMVTGSHIPANRNGLKFYVPSGEITKNDETNILQCLGIAQGRAVPGPETVLDASVGEAWVKRYVSAFGSDALHGLRIGVWSHSAVSRDLLLEAMEQLGAAVTEIGRRSDFYPVDTEAVSPAMRRDFETWATRYGLDAIISTDGDGDRPLLADAAGSIVPGDVLGQITAWALSACVVVTPVSSNTGVELGGYFERVIRTKIGSPYVIAEMQKAGAGCVGYEANGGFLLGFEAPGATGSLPPLMTRDSLLPLVTVLAEARKNAGGVAGLVNEEPARFTASDRLEGISSESSRAFLAQLENGGLSGFLADLEEEAIATDQTDGLRITLASQRVLHMRPSGNAPEFRMYVEAETPQIAKKLLSRGLGQISALFA